jgi:hypothetical protein
MRTNIETNSNYGFKRSDKQYRESSPEYNRNVSLTTAATITAAEPPPSNKPAFQI